MFGDGNRSSDANARTPLVGNRVRDAVYTGLAAMPEIGVEREPEAGLEVVADVAFKGHYRVFGLHLQTGNVLVVRKKFLIGGEEPSGSVGVHNPVAPAFGIA